MHPYDLPTQGAPMTDTERTTRPIHGRWTLDPGGAPAILRLDGSDTAILMPEGVGAFRSLLATAGKVHAVLVGLPSCAGGGEICTWSYPNGAVEASWRQSARDTWYPVELLDGGSVCVAP